MQRAVCALLFFALVAEGQDFFLGHWNSPMKYAADILFFPVPGLRFPLMHLIFALILVIVGSSPKPQWAKRVLPVDRGLRLALFTCIFMYIWGLARGGDFKIAMFQTHWFVMMHIMALAIAGIFRTTADYSLLGKVILAAAAYRSLMAIYIYFTFIRTGALLHDPPNYLTTHGDSMLFVTAFILVVNYVIELKTKRALTFALPMIVLLLLAIQFNNRRLAWVSLVEALAIVLVVLPPPKMRRAMISAILALLPILIMYIVIGWGRTESIFKPVRSFASMLGSTEDVSSEMRNIENYNLIVTFRAAPVIGLGWGHGYIEEVRALSIAYIFPWYREVPHNSLLGLLAFTGVAGFMGLWLQFPMVVYAGARLYRLAESPIARVVGGTIIAAVIAYANQLYGDMGLISNTVQILGAVAIAAACRVPVFAGVWPDQDTLEAYRARKAAERERGAGRHG